MVRNGTIAPQKAVGSWGLPGFDRIIAAHIRETASGTALLSSRAGEFLILLAPGRPLVYATFSDAGTGVPVAVCAVALSFAVVVVAFEDTVRADA